MRALALFLIATFAFSVSANAADHGADKGALQYSDKDAFEGGELRSLARIVIRDLYGPCSQPTSMPEQVSRFEALRASGGRHADRIDLHIADRAHQLYVSRIRVFCRPVEGDKRYFEFVRSNIDIYLERIEQIMQDRPDYAEETFTGAYTAQDVQRGIAVQEAASLTFAQITSPCGGNSEQLESIAAKYAALQQSASTHARRIDFAVGEADHEYAMSLVDLFCPEPGSPEEMAEIGMREGIAAGFLERLENAIASAYPSEE